MSKPRRRKARPPTPSSAPQPVSLRASAPPSSSPSRPKRKRKRKRNRPSSAARSMSLRVLGGALIRIGVALLVCLAPLWTWSVLAGPGDGHAFTVLVDKSATVDGLSELLVKRGALRSPRLFRAYWALLQPGFEFAPGEHLLNDSASPRGLAQRLARSAARSSRRVTLPEGFQSLQIGQRLEHAEVCTQAAFRNAVTDSVLLRELGVEGASIEGYLFPASYGLLVDSDAHGVVRVLVGEARKRLQKLYAAHPGRLEQLGSDFGFHEREVLTLASIIEKEAHLDDERPQIASVFFNRLRDPEFRPARMLQSDPTASYGCLVAGPEIPSCAGFKGSVTPALLRDAANPYNTYRHAGLPPGPIANPGEASIEAVLAPARSDYLYFVAKGGGRHNFSRTFAEHRGALEAAH